MNTPVSIVGIVATDPRLVQTGGSVPLCTFRVASSDRRYDRDRQEWVPGETNWFSVSAFRTLATHAHESFAKGDRVIISGRLRVRRWETQEKSGVSVEVEADALGHDLRWGVSRFTKRYGPGQEGGRGESPDGHEARGGRETGTGGWLPAPSSGPDENGPDESGGADENGGAEQRSDGFVPVTA